MLIHKSYTYALFLLLSIFAIPLASSADGIIPLSDYTYYDDSIPLMEYSFIEVDNGYYLNVYSVDTYSNTVELSITYGSVVLIDQIYSPGTHFSYYDDKISIDFDIDSLYTDAYYIDYVLISNVEVSSEETYTTDTASTASTTSTTSTTGSIAITTTPPGVEVYLNGYYMGTTGSDYFWIYDVQPGTHTIGLSKVGYQSLEESVYVYSGEVYYHPRTLSTITDISGTGYSDSTQTDDAIYGVLGLLMILVVVVFLLLFLVLLLKGKKKGTKQKKTVEPVVINKVSKAPPVVVEPIAVVSPPLPTEKPQKKITESVNTPPVTGKNGIPIVVKSAFQYAGASIQYKVKVENLSKDPIGDIKVDLFVPDVFYMQEKEKTISMLEPGESKTATFEIRPTGECGDCVISGSITYYDYSLRKRRKGDIVSKMVSIICPVLRRREIHEDAWRQKVNKMLVAEEESLDLDIPAENLFDISSRVLRDLNLYMLNPETTSTPQLFTGVARFFAEGVSGMEYAAYVEVVGKRKSRLILKAWAQKEEALTGFYHKMLEEIQKRTDVNLFVDTATTQYNITSTTTIQDSVIQRSNIGSGKKKCPKCGRDVEEGEKFCMQCGEKLE